MKAASFEGGGVRGIMQAEIMAVLEEASGKPAWCQFDLMAGTSVGSIIAACLAVGIPAPEVVKFFTERAAGIFSGSWWIPLPRLWASAKYPATGLHDALVAILGTRTLADCKTDFIATAFEMKTGRTTYFQSYGVSRGDADELVIGPDSLMPLVDVCMASSAAQTYFPAHAWRQYIWWDGGSTGFNAPDMLALSECRSISPAGVLDLKMLSIGNGNTPWPWTTADQVNPGLLTVAGATARIAYSGPETAMVWLARQQLGPRHIRLNPVIPDFAIDDARWETLTAMQHAAHQCLDDQPGALPQFYGG